MALVLVDAGELIALKALVNNTAPQNLVLRLYQNNVTPGETDTAGTYAEATFTGYAAITLVGASWTFSGTAPTQAAYPQQTFTSSAPQATQQIYGYYLTQLTSGTLVWAEKFASGPYPIANNGDNVQVTVQITAD